MIAFVSILISLIVIGIVLRQLQKPELNKLRAEAESLGVVVPTIATPAKLRRLIKRERKLLAKTR